MRECYRPASLQEHRAKNDHHFAEHPRIEHGRLQTIRAIGIDDGLTCCSVSFCRDLLLFAGRSAPTKGAGGGGGGSGTTGGFENTGT